MRDSMRSLRVYLSEYKDTRYLVFFTAAALGALVFAFIGAKLAQPKPFLPLYGYSVPQDVHPESETARPGGHVLVTGTKCNRFSRAVGVTGNAWLRKIDGESRLEPYFSGAGLLEPGCVTRTWRNELPAHLSPGTYIITGEDTVLENGRHQTVVWETEPFTVIASDE